MLRKSPAPFRTKSGRQGGGKGFFRLSVVKSKLGYAQNADAFKSVDHAVPGVDSLGAPPGQVAAKTFRLAYPAGAGLSQQRVYESVDLLQRPAVLLFPVFVVLPGVGSELQFHASTPVG